MQWLQDDIVRVLFLLLATCCSSRQVLCASCPPGWLNWQQSCYFTLPGRMNWFQASEACDRPGGSLVVPNSEEENRFISQSIVQREQEGLWIGCTDAAQEGVWLCGGQPAQYNNWASRRWRQDRDHNCARMTTHKANSEWSDSVPCGGTKHKSGACEMKAFDAAPTYHTIIGPDGSVPQQCLLHHGIQNITVDGLFACGWACWSNPQCHSFNLWQSSKAEKMCQLNNATRLGAEPSEFRPINGCYYFDL